MIPLTEAQRGLWYAQQLASENPAFNTAHVLWLRGSLQVALFRQAVDQATSESDALAIRMYDLPSGPSQQVDENYRPWLEIVDLSAVADPQKAARQWMEKDRLTPINPVHDRLVQQTLFELGEDRYAWYVRMHHLMNDGYGMALFSDRVCAIYNALCQQKSVPSAFAPLTPVFAEDAEYQTSERKKRDSDYWQTTLHDLPAAVGLSSGFASASGDCLRQIHSIDSQLQAQLHLVAEQIGQPWPDLLTALTAAYCQRMAGVAEVVVGVPFMGRLGSTSARVPMMVMNVLPLRVQAHSELKVAVFVQQVARNLVRGRRHGRYRGEQIRRDLGLIGGQRRLHGPLINIQPFYRPTQLTDLQAELEILATGPVDDVTIGFRGDARSILDLEFEANPALYTPAELAAHAQRLIAFLRAAFETHLVDGVMADIPLASPAESHRFLFEVNATSHQLPDTTLVDLFEAQMDSLPEALALVYQHQRLSYAELEIRTRALALQLQQQFGVGAESVVAVALPRSLELVIALLAVQRAGGAYLPVDLDHPDSRIARIFESSRPACVLTQGEDSPRFQGSSPVLETHNWELTTTKALHTKIAPENAAYVIYTSGSTGQPKGVVIEHRAIVNRLEWMRTHYGFEPSDRFLQKTPATFDVSVWEFFLPFITGAALFVAPPEAHRDPLALVKLIQENRITTIHFVPSMLSAFLAAPESHGLEMRRVFCSGEELSAEQRQRFHQQITAELHNLYGPTEAAVDVSFWPANTDDTSRPVPIGFPVWNTELYILDEQMRPLPPGVAGDLYLGGVQLARGYLGQPELTAERFIAGPECLQSRRIYRTGDIAHWRDDGAVVFLGRSDHQVKIRGLRIELGEIEAAILADPKIERAEVIVREDRPGDKRLVAYLQSSGELNIHALRLAVSAKVPDYMIPTAFVPLELWPVTANGKLDRKSLPAPETDTGAGVPLQTETEQDLAQIYREILGLESELGSDADFFILGGDSLQAVHLLIAIQQRWHRNPGLEALFTSPTISGLAAVLDAGREDTQQGLTPVLQLASGDAEQSPLFVVHPAGGICWNYRELAHRLEPKRNVYGLQSPALLEDSRVPETIELLAEEYSQRVLSLQPQGKIHLLGWSVGGIIAHAMAVRLEAHGHEVGVLALLDAYPSECWRAEPEPDAIAALRALLAIAGYDPEQHLELDSRSKIIEFLRRGNSALGNLPEQVLDGVVRAVTGTNRLVREHYHRKFSGRLLHLRAGRDHLERPHLQSALWEPYAAEVEAVELPFLHAELTGRDASAKIAPLLNCRF